MGGVALYCSNLSILNRQKMKTNYLKCSMLLLAASLTISVKAQTASPAKTAENIHLFNDFSHEENGKMVGHVAATVNGKEYRLTFINEKMSKLNIDGDDIPAANWGKYESAIAYVREEMRKQRARNEEQAKKNAEQAKLNAVQEKKNKEQEVLNLEQGKKNAEQAERNAIQAKKNEEQAQLNREQEKRNAIQVAKNHEQEKLNEIQAVKNAEQAKANEQMIKDITEDLVSDKLIPDATSLHEFVFNPEGMSINGVKQPYEVFKKYKAKYSKVFDGNFKYSKDGITTGK